MNIKEYLQKKKKREEKSGDFQQQIRKHRAQNLARAIAITAVLAILVTVISYELKNQVFTSYTVVAGVQKTQYSGVSVRSYQDGFISYSKDGISYTDYKGNAMWNQTYEMQSPIVSVNGEWVAVADYNGHIIYDIALDGTLQEIDTNLPVRNLTVAANGVVAAVLEDGNVTWINVYNPNGQKAIGIKTTMQKSGYPMSISLSDSGKLMQVAYLRAESGSMKSVMSFYNFDEVGQNYTDTMVSSFEYGNAVIPFSAFTGTGTAFALADNQLLFFEGNEIPKNISQIFLDEEIQDVYYGSGHIGLVFDGRDGNGKYRIVIYSSSGEKEFEKSFDLEYRDVVFTKDNFIIYNEAECIITSFQGKEKYAGEITEQTLLLKPLGGKRYLAVTKESLDIIELN